MTRRMLSTIEADLSVVMLSFGTVLTASIILFDFGKTFLVHQELGLSI